MSERRYLAPLPLGGDEGPPWSKGLMARALAATGLSVTRAYDLARRADADLAERGATASTSTGSASSPRTCSARRRAAARCAACGGSTRCTSSTCRSSCSSAARPAPGKSTIATEAAHRLGITRVTSTDFIRQTMRAFFSPEFMPSVHYSSFEAGLALTKAEEDEAGDARLLGFLDQTRNVLVGVEAAIERSLAEGWSMVLEGVHLVPGMVAMRHEDAIVVQCMLAIEDEDLHRSHFWVRDHATDGLRPLEKYLDGMPEIRLIQDSLIERARRCDVPVIVNSSLDQAMGEVLDLVLSTADRLVRA